MAVTTKQQLTPAQRQAIKQAKDRRYYARHRAKLLAKMRARYHARRATMTADELAAHRAKQLAAQKRYDTTHAETIRAKRKAPEFLALSRAYQRQRRAQDPEAFRARDRARYNEHPEPLRASHSAWSKRNPQAACSHTMKRHARLRNVSINDATPEQRQAVLDAADGVCAYCPFYNPTCIQCRKHTHKLAIDHVTAVANGGANTLHNFVACCKSCNSKKRTGPAPIPVQPLLLIPPPSRNPDQKAS